MIYIIALIIIFALIILPIKYWIDPHPPYRKINNRSIMTTYAELTNILALKHPPKVYKMTVQMEADDPGCNGVYYDYLNKIFLKDQEEDYEFVEPLAHEMYHAYQHQQAGIWGRIKYKTKYILRKNKKIEKENCEIEAVAFSLAYIVYRCNGDNQLLHQYFKNFSRNTVSHRDFSKDTQEDDAFDIHTLLNVPKRVIAAEEAFLHRYFDVDDNDNDSG